MENRRVIHSCVNGHAQWNKDDVDGDRAQALRIMFVFIVGMITETSTYSEGLYNIISPLRLYIINKKV